MAGARGGGRAAIGQDLPQAAGDQMQLLLAPPRFLIALSGMAWSGSHLSRQQGRPLVVEAEQQGPLAGAVAAAHRTQQRDRCFATGGSTWVGVEREGEGF